MMPVIITVKAAPIRRTVRTLRAGERLGLPCSKMRTRTGSSAANALAVDIATVERLTITSGAGTLRDASSTALKARLQVS